MLFAKIVMSILFVLNKDLWFIGSIDNLTTGIWLGYDDNKESELSSGNAAYLWKKFISEIYKIPIKK